MRERYRGLAEEFIGLDPVLEIGFGRGEFLELLDELGVKARGIEPSTQLVHEGREQGLDVEFGTAVEYLAGAPCGEPRRACDDPSHRAPHAAARHRLRAARLREGATGRKGHCRDGESEVLVRLCGHVLGRPRSHACRCIRTISRSFRRSWTSRLPAPSYTIAADREALVLLPGDDEVTKLLNANFERINDPAFGSRTTPSSPRGERPMRLLFVVQRYGEDVAGGAEQHCREFAERLVGRGHDVEVLTTCASSYVDWANVYPPGLDVDQRRHRAPHARRRSARNTALVQPSFNCGLGRGRAGATSARRAARVDAHAGSAHADGHPGWLRQHARDYDCVSSSRTSTGRRGRVSARCAGAVPTLLHPTAHDEPPLHLSIFDEVFRLPDALAFLTPEEAALVGARFPGVARSRGRRRRRRAGARRRDRVPPAVRARVGAVSLLRRPRRPAKGATELLDYFAAYKARHADDLKLVLLGESVMDLPTARRRRRDRLRRRRDPGTPRSPAAVALVHPSYFESFSMVLTEAFALERPALVQRACAVTAGHARRSGAALPYRGFAEFEAAVETLLERPGSAIGARPQRPRVHRPRVSVADGARPGTRICSVVPLHERRSVASRVAAHSAR